LYAGDGVSDLSAAAETDLLFAKKGHGMTLFLHHIQHLLNNVDLIRFCEREGMPFTVFEDWSTILSTTQDIYNGKVSVKKVAEQGLEKVQAGEAGL
jgi:2-hydroxy-3-keto-5-methylthiopentenyl-1-phosphate phosphatase